MARGRVLHSRTNCAVRPAAGSDDRCTGPGGAWPKPDPLSIRATSARVWSRIGYIDLRSRRYRYLVLHTRTTSEIRPGGPTSEIRPGGPTSEIRPGGHGVADRPCGQSRRAETPSCQQGVRVAWLDRVGKRVASGGVAALVAGHEPSLALSCGAVRPGVGVHLTAGRLLDPVVTDGLRRIDGIADLGLVQRLEELGGRGVVRPDPGEAVRLEFRADRSALGARPATAIGPRSFGLPPNRAYARRGRARSHRPLRRRSRPDRPCPDGRGSGQGRDWHWGRTSWWNLTQGSTRLPWYGVDPRATSLPWLANLAATSRTASIWRLGMTRFPAGLDAARPPMCLAVNTHAPNTPTWLGAPSLRASR